MITSSLTSWIFWTRSSSLALPSGFRTDLSKSKNASAAKVTLEDMTGAGGAAAGATTGAGAGAAAAAGTIAPSQLAAAVAGVQLASRQHNSLVPFFQTSSLVPLRQLSTVWAPAAVTSAAEAINIATLFNFFMVLLLGKKPQPRCETGRFE